MHPLKKVQRLLLKRGFSEFRPSSEFMAELNGLPENDRRGIYVHAMKDGTEFYAGLSIDVVARYRQHLQTYGTIEQSAFLSVPSADLAPIEMECITSLREMGVTMLNVLLPDENLTATDIAEILDQKTLEQWVNAVDVKWHGGPKTYDEAELARFKAKYAKLCAHPVHSDELMDLLSLFIRTCIPHPDRTEKTFWTLNCMTEAFQKHSSRAIYRLSVHRPEVLTVVHNTKDPSMLPFEIMFTIDSEVMTASERRSFEQIDNVSERSYNVYKRANFQHHRVSAHTVEAAQALMRHRGFVRSIKSCVAKLVCNGQVPRNFSQSHCLPLYRDVLSRPF